MRLISPALKGGGLRREKIKSVADRIKSNGAHRVNVTWQIVVNRKMCVRAKLKNERHCSLSTNAVANLRIMEVIVKCACGMSDAVCDNELLRPSKFVAEIKFVAIHYDTVCATFLLQIIQTDGSLVKHIIIDCRNVSEIFERILDHVVDYVFVFQISEQRADEWRAFITKPRMLLKYDINVIDVLSDLQYRKRE